MIEHQRRLSSQCFSSVRKVFLCSRLFGMASNARTTSVRVRLAWKRLEEDGEEEETMAK
jgi:hypothetical protein